MKRDVRARDHNVMSVSLGQALVALAAFAAASPLIAAAAIEPAPREPAPTIQLVLASAWTLVFTVAAVVDGLDSSNLAAVGLLAAAAELSAAAVIWFARSRPRRGRHLSVPKHYWQRWEAEFAEHWRRRDEFEA